jgi:AAA domain, putative AbiEii toxin, Type IV TA system/AAA domain/SIR2-like domain
VAVGAVATGVAAAYAYWGSKAALRDASHESGYVETDLERAINQLASSRVGLAQPVPVSLELSDPPEALVRAIVDGTCVLVAGAGFGAAAGLRAWSDTLTRAFLDLANQLPDQIRSEARSDLASGRYEAVIDTLNSELSIERVRDALVQAAGKPNPGVSDLSRALHGLPFTGAITDLWAVAPICDALVGDPVILRPGELDDASLLLRRRQKFILQAYGDATAPNTVLVHGRELADRLRLDQEYARFLHTVATTNSLLFIGMSLDGIEELLDAIAQSSRGHTHYALVPWQADAVSHARQLSRRHGVETIFYAPSHKHAEVLKFAMRIQVEVSKLKPQRYPREADLAPPLTRIILTGIGPFEKAVEIALHPRVTVLLGDNGSGKSSVLRAIALALSGDGPEAQRAAARALSIHTNLGSIELEIAADRYTTTLVRDGTRTRLKSNTISPVASGLWLAIAFPPLRGVSSTDIAGPVATAVREPSPDDLLPLATDSVDERLDDVRQWLVNTALLSDESSKDGSRAMGMLKAFFAIVNSLTPDFAVDYHGLDRRTWEVMVNTPDGLLPLSHLSRGITATLGWIGVLLQRIYDIYDDIPDPSKARALLLIDEIDVHLHPAWQRLILPRLLEGFPNLQIVATTHSPLVVGSLKDAQLVHLTRMPDGIVAEHELPRFEGWRADQILTSSAFDLETSRDPETEREMRDYEARRLAEGSNDRDTEQLARTLARRLSGPQETEDARLAARLVQQELGRQLDDLSDERKQAVVEQAERYLDWLRQGG